MPGVAIGHWGGGGLCSVGAYIHTGYGAHTIVDRCKFRFGHTFTYDIHILVPTKFNELYIINVCHIIVLHIFL